MSTVSIDRTLDQPLHAVWAAFDDFGGVYRFHPFVERSPLADNTPAEGLGAERVCHFYDGNHVRERVTGRDPLRSLDVEITEGSMPLRCANAHIELHPEGTGTRVRMTMRYEPSMGVLGKVMDRLMMRRKFAQLLTTVLAALDEHLRTGETIGKGFRPRAVGVAA